jgi:hypothetical protein
MQSVAKRTSGVVATAFSCADGLELLSGSAATATMSAVPKSGASSMRFSPHPAAQP